MDITAKPIDKGGSQAVRIPKAPQLRGVTL